jgi:predicted RNA methylase
MQVVFFEVVSAVAIGQTFDLGTASTIINPLASAG